jgi:23S rRNA pseudouridine1911/1915/1917 synthase
VAGLSGGGEEGRIGIVHRLDRDTSGLLIVARNESSLRLLRSALQKREIERRYAALVLGHPRTLEGLVDAPIGRDRRHRTKISLHTDTPREARTRFRVEEDLPDSALLDVALETGRTHQIRVHLESIGLPVAGDPVYGSAGVFGLKRQFLHARSLSFRHPVSNELLTLQSPLPDDLEDALARARRGETP